MSKTWNNGPFIPATGKCYEVSFGQIKIGGKTGQGSARIRVDGSAPSQWIDIDTNKPLAAHYAQYVVQSYREIECPKFEEADADAR